MYARKGKKIAARAVHIDPGLHTDKVSKSLIISSPSDIVIFDLQLAIYLDFHKDIGIKFRKYDEYIEKKTSFNPLMTNWIEYGIEKRNVAGCSESILRRNAQRVIEYYYYTSINANWPSWVQDEKFRITASRCHIRPLNRTVVENYFTRKF